MEKHDCPSDGEMRLQVENVTRTFGALRAVDRVSLEVETGARHALIGPNGAGKSTLLGIIAGRDQPTEGRVSLDDTDVTAWDQPQRSRLGVGLMYQTSNVFRSMTVGDNVAIAAQRVLGVNHRWLTPVKRFKSIDEAVQASLVTLGLEDRVDQIASALSHGERRRLEMALALAVQPDLLLLDEPTSGLTDGEANSLIDTVRALPGEMTVVVVEHNLDVVAALATEVTVLHAGSVLARGSWESVTSDANVQRAYLSRRGTQP
jgi:branched-chain amino acid transport system ATP-binding protein